MRPQRGPPETRIFILITASISYVSGIWNSTPDKSCRSSSKWALGQKNPFLQKDVTRDFYFWDTLYNVCMGAASRARRILALPKEVGVAAPSPSPKFLYYLKVKSFAHHLRHMHIIARSLCLRILCTFSIFDINSSVPTQSYYMQEWSAIKDTRGHAVFVSILNIMPSCRAC
jgi:hypothetical protein